MDVAIPIVINNFNRLTLTRNLASSLWNMGYHNIHILDNNSSYPELLNWYSSTDCSRYVIHRTENHGALAIYNSGYINNWLHKRKWIAYTDCDIVLNPLTPQNFIDLLIQFAEKYNYIKAGLALKRDDLPDNLYGNHYRDWEARYWTEDKLLEKDVYKAHIDTTFCVIQPGQAFDYEAIRLAGNFTARHQPWYTDFNNMDDEEKYFLEHSSANSSYKRFYNNEIMQFASI